MSAGSTVFKVTDKTFGPINAAPKQQIDARRLIFDFTKWLDTGEVIAALSSFAIVVNTNSSLYAVWQTDFPVPIPTSPTPADTNPLVLDSSSIVSSGTRASLLVGGGTPALGYILSFVVTSSGGRQKEIDVLIDVNPTVNSLITSTSTTPASVTVVSATTVLGTGTNGSVYIENVTAAPITITMPSLPRVLGQSLTFTDVNGNAGLYNVTLQDPAGALINGETTFVMDANYQSVTLEWTGTAWSVR